MDQSNSLKLRILDCTQRLPGPLAGAILAELGHEIDSYPIREGIFKNHPDSTLNSWHSSLKTNKTLVSRPDFKDYQVLIEPPKNLKLPLTGKRLVIRLKADPKKAKLHDLNALAETGLLKIALKDRTLPFIPLGGTLFGYHIATSILSEWIRLKEESTKEVTLFLTDPLKNVMKWLFPTKEIQDQKKYLHNGLYPCYNVYTTKDDHWLVCAALEIKFFQEFLKILEIPSAKDQRFNQDFVEVLQKRINELSLKELRKLIGDQEICITLLTKD